MNQGSVPDAPRAIEGVDVELVKRGCGSGANYSHDIERHPKFGRASRHARRIRYDSGFPFRIGNQS